METMNTASSYYGFSERLKKRASKYNYKDAVDLAVALSDNRQLRALIQPKVTKAKKSDHEVQYKSGKKPSSLGATQYNTILRQVQEHWKTSDPFKIPTKYILAYSRLLGCSTDYLYGLTKVETANIEARAICEKTGLSENAVINLINSNSAHDELGKSTNYYWSVLLEGPLYQELARDWLDASIQAMKAAGNEHNLRIANKLIAQGVSDEHLGARLDPSALNDAASTYRDAYEGTLYRLYRKIVNLIEQNIKYEYDDTLQWLSDISAERNDL